MSALALSPCTIGPNFLPNFLTPGDSRERPAAATLLEISSRTFCDSAMHRYFSKKPRNDSTTTNAPNDSGISIPRNDSTTTSAPNDSSISIPNPIMNQERINVASVESSADNIDRDPGKRRPIIEYEVQDRDRIRREYISKGPFQPKGHVFKKSSFVRETKMMGTMNLIDTLERLGVSYHFENEIEDKLQQFFNLNTNYHDDEAYDLYTVALHFRLYEASYLRTHGETILDDALAFTTATLKSMVPNLGSSLKKQVEHALVQPLHLGIPRIEARIFIDMYEEEVHRNETLIKLAKLDYNLLQMLHREELQQVSMYHL